MSNPSTNYHASVWNSSHQQNVIVPCLACMQLSIRSVMWHVGFLRAQVMYLSLDKKWEKKTPQHLKSQYYYRDLFEISSWFNPEEWHMQHAQPAAEAMCCRQQQKWSVSMVNVHEARMRRLRDVTIICPTENPFQHRVGGILFNYCMLVLHLSCISAAVSCCSWYTTYQQLQTWFIPVSSSRGWNRSTAAWKSIE